MTTAAEQLETHLQQEIGQVLFGMDDAIHNLAIALVAQGHVLVEGAPGLGKTLLAKSLASLLDGKFKRIQCTADMMPSDITGIHVFNSEKNSFDLLPGPIFTDVLLADEINRTGPKTQSALLEAMEERRVTLDRNTYELPQEFMVLATQNPMDFEGVYPLPESQLDRFLLRILISYLESDSEIDVLRQYDKPGSDQHLKNNKLNSLPENLIEQARQQAGDIHVADSIYRYVAELAAATRNHPGLTLGLSTRGALALMRCARVEAALNGRDYLTPDNIKAVAKSVVPHRLVLTPEASLEGLDGLQLFQQIESLVETPRDTQ